MAVSFTTDSIFEHKSSYNAASTTAARFLAEAELTKVITLLKDDVTIKGRGIYWSTNGTANDNLQRLQTMEGGSYVFKWDPAFVNRIKWEDVKINKHLNNLCCANIDNFISLHYENPGLSTNINDNSQDTYDIKKIDVENILVEKNVKISYIIDMQNDTEFTEKYKEKINTTVFDIGDINDYIHTILLQDCCIVSLSITINEKTSYALKNLYKTLQFYNYSGMICFKNINSLINTL